MKIQEKSGQHSLTIPKRIMIANGWKKGDILEFILNKSGRWELITEGE